MRASELATWLEAVYLTYGDCEVFVQSDVCRTTDGWPQYRPVSHIPDCVEAKPEQLLIVDEKKSAQKIISLRPGIR